MEEPGQKLKKIRERLRLRFRDVEEASARIAALHSNDEFVVALSRLADIENKGTMPSAYRLYSLCAIYRVDMSEVLGWYGVSLSTLPADAAVVQHTQTHMINFRAEEGEIQVPISLDPGIDLSRTVFPQPPDPALGHPSADAFQQHRPAEFPLRPDRKRGLVDVPDHSAGVAGGD